MPKTKTSLIHLMRHGEPVGGRKYRGKIDDPLTPKGWQQMHTAIETLTQQGIQWDLIMSSPLKRCAEFSHQLGTQQRINVLENSQFCEIGMGDWEGRTSHDIEQNNPEDYRRFFQDPVNARPNNGEALADFQIRVVTAWQQLLNQHPHKNILLIAHAGVLRAIVCHLLQAPLSAMYRMRFKNAALIPVKLTPEQPPMVDLSP